MSVFFRSLIQATTAWWKENFECTCDVDWLRHKGRNYLLPLLHQHLDSIDSRFFRSSMHLCACAGYHVELAFLYSSSSWFHEPKRTRISGIGLDWWMWECQCLEETRVRSRWKWGLTGNYTSRASALSYPGCWPWLGRTLENYSSWNFSRFGENRNKMVDSCITLCLPARTIL